MGTHTDLKHEQVTSALHGALQYRASTVVETDGLFDSVVAKGKLSERRRKRARRIFGVSTVVTLAVGAIGLSRVELVANKNVAVPELSVESLEMPSFRLVPGTGTDEYELENTMFDHERNVGFGSFWGDSSRQVTVRTFINSAVVDSGALVLPQSLEAMIDAGPNGSHPSSSQVQVLRTWRSEVTKFDVTVTFPPSTSWDDQVAVARSIRIGTSGEITTTTRPFGLPLVFSGSWSGLAPIEQWSMSNRKDFWLSAERPNKVAQKLDQLGFTGFVNATDDLVVVRRLSAKIRHSEGGPSTFTMLSWVEQGWTITASVSTPSGQDLDTTKARLITFVENLRPATEEEWLNVATPNSSLFRVSGDMQKPTRVVAQTDIDATQWKLQMGEGVTDAKCINISVTLSTSSSSTSGEVLKDCVALSGGPVLFSAITTNANQRVLVALFNGTVDAVKVRGSRDPNESITTEGLVIANNPEWTYVGALVVPLVGNDDVSIEAFRVLPSAGIDVDAPDVDAAPLTDEELATLDTEVLEPAPTESLGSFTVK